MIVVLRLAIVLGAACVLGLQLILRRRAERYLIYHGESKVCYLTGADYSKRENYAADGWPLVRWLQGLLVAWLLLAPFALWVLGDWLLE